MNLDTDIFINGIDSYVEYQYGEKRMGIFGRGIYNTPTVLKYLSFSKFLKVLTEYDSHPTMNDFYYSESVGDGWRASAKLKVHAPTKLPKLAGDMTVQELKLFIRDTIGPLINTKEPIIGEYTRVRMIPLLRKSAETENARVLLGMITRMYNVLIVGNILMEMLRDKSAKNCIVYVTSSQLREFDYFFKYIIPIKLVVEIHQKTPFSFSRNEKRLSFLFERTEIRFIKSFDESYENCGVYRQIPTSNEFLLSMCDAIPLADVRYIYGPVTYAEFTNGERNIAVFGEYHDIPFPDEGVINKRNTISVPSLIKIVLDTFPKKFYDLFIEYDYTRMDGEPIFFGITSFNPIFSKCMKVVKECPFNNIRVHYTDYRSILYNNDIYKSITRYYHNQQFLHESDPYFTIENLTSIFENSIEIVKDTMLKDPKLRIILETPIYYFVLMELEKINDNFSRLTQFVRPLTIGEINEDVRPLKIGDIRTILFFMMNIYALFMDMYTLGRVFKSFASKDPSHPRLALNSVIYAGEIHARNYRNYLSSAGFKMVHFTETNTGNPLDFTGIRNDSFLFKL